MSDLELIRESEWMRIYRNTRDGTLVHESKLLTQGLQLSAKDILSRWDTLTEEDRLDLAQALQVKKDVTEDDERILNFLMEVGDEGIWITIAPILAKHHDKDRTLQFLLRRIEASPSLSKANYFQAIEQLEDASAVPILKKVYAAYRANLRSLTENEYFDYLACVNALDKLEHSPEYRKVLTDTAHSDKPAFLKSWAEYLLKSKT